MMTVAHMYGHADNVPRNPEKTKASYYTIDLHGHTLSNHSPRLGHYRLRQSIIVLRHPSRLARA